MPEREMPDQVGHNVGMIRHDVETVINDVGTVVNDENGQA